MQKAGGGYKRRLLQFRLHGPEPLIHHAELIFRNGRFAGYIRAGAYGFTLGASVGLGFVESGEFYTADHVGGDSWEIDIIGKTFRRRSLTAPPV